MKIANNADTDQATKLSAPFFLCPVCGGGGGGVFCGGSGYCCDGICCGGY